MNHFLKKVDKKKKNIKIINETIYFMACQNPSYAVRLADGMKPKFIPPRVDNSYENLFSRYGSALMLLPCGHCPSCLAQRSKEWAVRISFEASIHLDNMFLTLTYNDDIYHGSNKEDLQKFFKRFRKLIHPLKIRYYAVGELGTESGRFHYHAIIFGYCFDDLYLLKRTESGKVIYRSPTLEKLWPFGLSSVGQVTPESAKYVSGYVNKKALSGVNSGEFSVMSRRPGIGSDRFKLSWFDINKIYSALGESSIPRFYKKMLEALYPDKYEEYQKASQEIALASMEDKTHLVLRGVSHVDELRNIEAGIYNRHFNDKRGL